MISQDKFIALLESLGFTGNKSIYSRTIDAAPARKEAVMKNYL